MSIEEITIKLNNFRETIFNSINLKQFEFRSTKT